MLGIENQTEPDNDMPLRVYGYDGAAYRSQIYSVKDAKGRWRANKVPRYPVVTLVLYFGTKRWDKATTLHEALGSNLPEELRPFVPDMAVNLFEVAFLPDEQVKLFQSDFRIVADYFTQMRKNKEYVPSAAQIRHVREVMQLMAVLTGDVRFENAVNEAREGRKVNSMEEWLTKAIQKGEKAGYQNGVKAKAKETALRMRRLGTNVDDIAYSVGESTETVKKWLGTKETVYLKQH